MSKEPNQLEGELRRTLISWINKSDVNYRLGDDHHGAGWTVDVNDLMKQILPSLQTERKSALEEAIKVASTHAEGEDLTYCDTGNDMGLACRSECVEMACKRVKDLLTNPTNQ